MTLLTVVTAGGRVNFGGMSYAPEGEILREGMRRLMVRSNSSLHVRFQPSTVPVTPCYMSAMYAARCMDPTEEAVIVGGVKPGWKVSFCSFQCAFFHKLFI